MDTLQGVSQQLFSINKIIARPPQAEIILVLAVALFIEHCNSCLDEFDNLIIYLCEHANVLPRKIPLRKSVPRIISEIQVRLSSACDTLITGARRI